MDKKKNAREVENKHLLFYQPKQK